MNDDFSILDDLPITRRKYAVGNDLVFLPNFEQSFNQLFKTKNYTENEIAYCELFDQSLLRYASTWAAKEAVYKAVKQIDKTPLSWKKIEVLRKKIAGEPYVILHTNPELEPQISLTLSHDADYIWAIAIVELP